MGVEWDTASRHEHREMRRRRLVIPALSLILLIGPSGAGKSTFARTHFRPTEVLSSDAFRAMIADDEADQTATREAFEILHRVAEARLRRGRLTVIDATNTRREARLLSSNLPGAITFPVSQSSSITRSKCIWRMTSSALDDKSDAQ